MKVGHIIGGDVGREASTRRRALERIIEANCWRVVQEEVGSGLTDQHCYRVEEETGESSHLCSMILRFELDNAEFEKESGNREAFDRLFHSFYERGKEG
jgi:hypothetical protein